MWPILNEKTIAGSPLHFCALLESIETPEETVQYQLLHSSDRLKNSYPLTVHNSVSMKVSLLYSYTSNRSGIPDRSSVGTLVLYVENKK